MPFSVSILGKVLVDPAAVFNEQKSFASYPKGILLYAGAGLVLGLLAVLQSVLFGPAPFDASIDLIPSLVTLISTPIATLFMALIGTAAVFGLGRLLGGSGSYRELFFVNSLYSIPFALITGFAMVEPIALGIAMGILFCWGLYLQYRAVTAVMGLGRWRGIIAVLIPSILLAALIVFVLVITFVFALIANPISSLA
jgi:hypothetical protein